MKQYIPVFPLKLVCFPGEKLNLHIFEQRYKQLILDSHLKGETFGIIPVSDGKIIELGTEVSLNKIYKSYDDGRMDIKTEGIRVFNVLRIIKNHKSKLYDWAEVEFINFEMSSHPVLASRVLSLVENLYNIMKIKKDVPKWKSGFSIYTIAHKIGLNYEQEIALLKLNNERNRLEYVRDHLETLVPLVSQMEEMRKKIEMNGHFKNVIPPDIK
ncbi:MAG: LON peptidase substrate-binding domain-containing protein [Bacteroidia bacterium]|nr:LON peptidase substrate-binding domain-containing protein [Bacteroidia bacterium]